MRSVASGKIMNTRFTNAFYSWNSCMTFRHYSQTKFYIEIIPKKGIWKNLLIKKRNLENQMFHNIFFRDLFIVTNLSVNFGIIPSSLPNPLIIWTIFLDKRIILYKIATLWQKHIFNSSLSFAYLVIFSIFCLIIIYHRRYKKNKNISCVKN